VTRPVAALLIFFLSGIAGLGYQIVWTRLFAVGLGHEVPSILAVVAAFFAGLALGALLLDRPISRSARPAIWYAAIELVIGLWSIATAFALPWLNTRLPHWIGAEPGPVRHWIIAFSVPLAALLPATAAMGATLPAMDRLFERLRARGSRGTSLSAAYAANTLGAVAGTLGATFILLPLLGFRSTLFALAAINIFCAAVALLILGRAQSEPSGAQIAASDPRQPFQRRRSALPWMLLGATGLLGIGYEVVAVRIMGQVLENTIYSFAAALSVYLLGTSLGAAAVHGAQRRERFSPWLDPQCAVPWLLTSLAAAVTLGVLALGSAGDIYLGVRSLIGGGAAGFAASLGGELALATAVFLLPTFCMGATFTLLAQQVRVDRGGVGAALALNTIFGSMAPPLFGVVALPFLGGKFSLLAIAAGYALLAVAATAPLRLRALAPLLVPAALALAAAPGDLALVEPLPGGRILEQREGVLGAVAVVTDAPPDSHRYLKINNKFLQGGTANDAFTERRMGHIPLLLHAAPKSALFLGVGTGATLGAASLRADLTADGIELVPEVIHVLHHFDSVNEKAGENPRLRIIAADARRYVASTDRRYDVIVADLFHPARDGAGSLYTVEHFTALRARLNPGGIVCQWLPLHQLESDVLRSIIRSFLEVFPHSRALLADFNIRAPALGLIGTETPLQLDASVFESRADGPELHAALSRLALRNTVTLLGCFLADEASLRAFAADAPLNTDDHPIVLFAAPRFAYRDDTTPFGRLAVLLDELSPSANAFFGDAPQAWARIVARRLNAFIQARDDYLRSAMAFASGDQRAAMDACVRAAAISADFPLAYDVVLAHARSLLSSDPVECARLLAALSEARPERTEARDLLKQLGGTP